MESTAEPGMCAFIFRLTGKLVHILLECDFYFHIQLSSRINMRTGCQRWAADDAGDDDYDTNNVDFDVRTFEGIWCEGNLVLISGCCILMFWHGSRRVFDSKLECRKSVELVALRLWCVQWGFFEMKSPISISPKGAWLHSILWSQHFFC